MSEPAQGAQSGQEAVFAASCDHKSRQASQTPAQRSVRNVKRALSVMRAGKGVVTRGPAKKKLRSLHCLGDLVPALFPARDVIDRAANKNVGNNCQYGRGDEQFHYVNSTMNDELVD